MNTSSSPGAEVRFHRIPSARRAELVRNEHKPSERAAGTLQPWTAR
jgi:hypothetical protein